jgi:hypothetical protein
MKNKLLLYIVTLIGGMVLTTACEDFLDTESLSNDSREYLCSNPTDARKMVNHIYSFFCEDSYSSRMSNNWMQNTDVEMALIPKEQAIAHNDRRGVWALNIGDFGDIRTCWEHNYNTIDFANQVIEGIEASDMYKAGDADMKQLLGEAYCLRAFRYFLLCNFWGDVPFSTTPSKYGENNNTPRVDKNIIYSHIIQDIINVEEDMKWADKMSSGVELMNREFAIGFIAKLALFRAGYSMQADGTMQRCQIDDQIKQVIYTDENDVKRSAKTSDDFYRVARAYCRKLIKLKDRTLPTNFKGIFDAQINTASSPNNDVLFEIGFVQNGGGDVGWNIGLSVVGGSKGSGTTYTNLSPKYACSFDKEDQRYAVTCAPYRYLTESTQNAMGPFGISPAKWCRLDLITPTADKNTGINWPVLRYPDVLLMLAEADNEINGTPTNEAKTMLKRVRDRAFVNSSDFNKLLKIDIYIAGLTSYESFKKAIINERAWEFGGECIRKFDLIRWNYYSEAIVNTIDWITSVGINSQQLNKVNNELIYDKNKVIEDMGVANILYFGFDNGLLQFENDIFTPRKDKDIPYKNAVTIKDDEIKAGFTNTSNEKVPYRIDFARNFISVSDQDPTTKQPYGTDDNGDPIKKGIINESILYSWYGLTDGVIYNGLEDSSPLKTKPTPYVMPIPASKVTNSGGVLSNDGYGIRNK